MTGLTRRAALARGGALATGALLPGLALASRAHAQDSAETDALERLVRAEQAGELAYSLAAEKAGGEAKALFERFAGHSGERATALAEALDQLGTEPPGASDDPASYDELARFDEAARPEEQARFFAELETAAALAYEGASGELEAPDLAVSAGQIGAAHAQARIALELLAGTPAPTGALPAALR